LEILADVVELDLDSTAPAYSTLALQLFRLFGPGSSDLPNLTVVLAMASS